MVSHARHDVHAGDDVGRVGDFDSDLGNWRTDRTHAVGNDEHSAAGHGAGEQAGQLLLHLCGVFPVVGGAGFFFGARADESLVFDAGYIGGIGADQKTIWALRGVERDRGAGEDEEPEQILIFLG